jgi:hypothetical protein
MGNKLETNAQSPDAATTTTEDRACTAARTHIISPCAAFSGKGQTHKVTSSHYLPPHTTQNAYKIQQAE